MSRARQHPPVSGSGTPVDPATPPLLGRTSSGLGSLPPEKDAPTPSSRTRRDRDPAGRPRQARPRDALGRPLPYGAEGVEPVPEEPLPPWESLVRARILVEEGRPFAAHEVLEARWKAAPDEERNLWQGLAQLCVALTHAERGNDVGAARLLERGAGRLASYAASGEQSYGLDLATVVLWARVRVGAAGISGGRP